LNTCIIGVGNAGINITTEVLNKVNLDYLLLENHSSTGLDFDNKIEITILIIRINYCCTAGCRCILFYFIIWNIPIIHKIIIDRGAGINGALKKLFMD